MTGLLVHPDMRAGLRQRLLTLQKATTGTVSNIGASGTVFTRAAGSFITDGFCIGDEITAAGFATSANNGVAMVTAISALQLTTDKALTTEAAGASVSIVAALPALRHWEGEVFSPTQGRPFVDESLLVPYSAPRAIGPAGVVYHAITFALNFVYPAGKGTLAVESMAAAALAHFARGTVFTYGSNRGRVEKVERRSLIQEPDWLRCPVQVAVAAYTSG